MNKISPIHILLLMSSMQIIADFESSLFLNNQVRSFSTAVSLFPFWKNAYAFWFDQQMDDDCFDAAPEKVEHFVRSVLRNKGIEDESDIKITFEPCGDNPVNAEYSHNSLCVCSSPSYVLIENKRIEFEVDATGNIYFSTSEISQEDALWELVEYYETIFANLHDALNLKKRVELEIKTTHKKFELRSLKKFSKHVNNLLEEYVAVIQHEAGHHYHKVTRGLMRANIVSPVLFSILCSGNSDLIKSKLAESKIRYLAVFDLFLSVMASMCSYCATTIFLSWFDRHQEWKADEFVDSNPYVLKALKRAIKRTQQYGNCSCCSKKSWFKRLKNIFINYLLADEPSVVSRLKRVDQRLASVDT